jgi:predicted alpha/beta-fold hydrolase
MGLEHIASRVAILFGGQTVEEAMLERTFQQQLQDVIDGAFQEYAKNNNVKDTSVFDSVKVREVRPYDGSVTIDIIGRPTSFDIRMLSGNFSKDMNQFLREFIKKYFGHLT